MWRSKVKKESSSFEIWACEHKIVTGPLAASAVPFKLLTPEALNMDYSAKLLVGMLSKERLNSRLMLFTILSQLQLLPEIS